MPKTLLLGPPKQARRSTLLLSVLLYVALDLSIPGMPGAFVFEPSESVESVRGARARASADLVAAPEAGGTANSSLLPSDHATRVVQASRVEPRGRPVRARSLLARVDPAPPSEDPH